MKGIGKILFIFGTLIAFELSGVWKMMCIADARFLTYENRKVDGTDGLDFNLVTKSAFVAVDT